MDFDMNNLSVVERYSLVLCAYRLDPNVSAEQFTEVLERLIKAVREEEQRAPPPGGS